MSNCFVIRARALTNEQEVVIRGIFGNNAQVTLAKELLDAGKYEMVKCDDYRLPRCENEEQVFDRMNLDSGNHMSVGDVIVWNNGKRQLCLNDGWFTI